MPAPGDFLTEASVASGNVKWASDDGSDDPKVHAFITSDELVWRIDGKIERVSLSDIAAATVKKPGCTGGNIPKLVVKHGKATHKLALEDAAGGHALIDEALKKSSESKASGSGEEKKKKAVTEVECWLETNPTGESVTMKVGKNTLEQLAVKIGEALDIAENRTLSLLNAETHVPISDPSELPSDGKVFLQVRVRRASSVMKSKSIKRQPKTILVRTVAGSEETAVSVKVNPIAGWLDTLARIRSELDLPDNAPVKLVRADNHDEASEFEHLVEGEHYIAEETQSTRRTSVMGR